MTNAKKVSDVHQTIVLLHLDLMHTQIAVMMQKLDLRISAQLMNLVKQMKVTAIPITNAKAICFVDQRIALFRLGFYLQLTAVNQKVIKQYTCYYVSTIVHTQVVQLEMVELWC